MLLHRTQARDGAAIAKRSLHGLTGALGGSSHDGRCSRGLGDNFDLQIAFTGFKTGPGVIGFLSRVEHEWVILANLLCLLDGFRVVVAPF